MIQKEIDRKQLKQVLHFRFSFEPRFSEVDKSLFLAPPLRTTSCNVHYSGPILYDDERETWSKSIVESVRTLRFVTEADVERCMVDHGVSSNFHPKCAI
jgi:hypothetical protein